MKRRVTKFWWGLAQLSLLFPTVFLSLTGMTAPKVIPTMEEYGAFLVGQWKPNRNTVVVFKDPFCPYCIKAIPDLYKLTNYNVFLFWAPILGDQSKREVEAIFRCSRPVSRHVLESVSAKTRPHCKGELNSRLLNLDFQVADNYKISAVPAYFMQGKQVSVARILGASHGKSPINGVHVPWSRYVAMKDHHLTQFKTTALILASGAEEQANRLIEENRPEYVFLGQDFIVKRSPLLPCHTGNSSCNDDYLDQYRSRFDEFCKLLGLSPEPGKATIVQQDGTLVSKAL